mgnify:CR=1 FL=1
MKNDDDEEQTESDDSVISLSVNATPREDGGGR